MMPLAVIALTVAGFGIGTSEFVIVGLLPEAARDLNVSIPRAGWSRPMLSARRSERLYWRY